MFKVTKYPQGTFSWADCVSTDSAKAKQFYADVMGWHINDMPMGDGQFYTMFEKEGASVAGLGQIQPELAAQGVPSHWNSYVTVDDVDAMAEKARGLGATIIQEPFDVFDSGRMTFFQDPTGARLAMWQPNNHIGAGLVNTPGAMTWNELATRDVDGACKFYSDLFGWETRSAGNQDYYFIRNNGRSNGGIMALSADWGDAPSTWMVYFSVANVDATVKNAQAKGGTLKSPVTDVPTIGRFAVIGDPAGAACTVIQLSQPEPWTVE